MTREEINELNIVEPYCFETDREEQWFNVGLKEGLEVGEKYMIEKACKWLDANFPEIKNTGSWYKKSFIEQFRKIMEE